MAGVAYLTAVPLFGWRVLIEGAKRETAVLLLLSPLLAGAALLARLSATGPMPGLLLFTLAGLLLILAGLWRAWEHRTDPARFGAALALAAAGFVLLAGLWAGPDAAAAEARAWSLAVAGLFLVARWRRVAPADQAGWLANGQRLIGLVLALAALTGLPLTAGFNGRAALFEAWLAAGGWVLVAVLALLQVGLVTAVCLFGLGQQETSDQAGPAAPDLAESAARLLLALGLLAWPVLGGVSWVVWTALLLPLLGGLLLARLLQNAPPAPTAVRWPVILASGHWGGGLRLLVSAVRDAAALLEGERGLLWLLLLAALILLTP
ncbi:MAG: hypothetical protein IPM39_06640 [Chloroflexi bacterium]|nr:hypothetical protein [Chloroflexota bacterium]